MGEKYQGHTHKTGSCYYLLGIFFEISDEHPILFYIWGSPWNKAWHRSRFVSNHFTQIHSWYLPDFQWRQMWKEIISYKEAHEYPVIKSTLNEGTQHRVNNCYCPWVMQWCGNAVQAALKIQTTIIINDWKKCISEMLSSWASPCNFLRSPFQISKENKGIFTWKVLHVNVNVNHVYSGHALSSTSTKLS